MWFGTGLSSSRPKHLREATEPGNGDVELEMVLHMDPADGELIFGGFPKWEYIWIQFNINRKTYGLGYPYFRRPLLETSVFSS